MHKQTHREPNVENPLYPNFFKEYHKMTKCAGDGYFVILLLTICYDIKIFIILVFILGKYHQSPNSSLMCIYIF